MRLPSFLPFLLGVFTFLSISSCSSAESKSSIGKMLAFTCNDRVSSSYVFGINASTSYYGGLCGYQPMLGSILNCIAVFSEDYLHRDTNTTFEEAFKVYNEYCYEYGDVETNVTYLEDLYKNATKYLIDYTTIANLSEPLYSPVSLNFTEVQYEYKGYSGFYDNYYMSNIYGGIILGYWGLIMLIAAIHNLMVQTRLIQKFNSPLNNYSRKYIVLPSLFNGPYTRVWSFWRFFSSLIATRLEFFIIFGYIIVHIAVLCVRYWYDHGLFFYPSMELQIARWISDRTGIIAFAHIPLIVLFGGRNNFFQWITGFNYSSFIQFHKWTGRVMFIDAMIHSAGYTRIELIYHELAAANKDVYWQFGVVATLFGGLLVFQSLNFFRSNKYEIFLFIHIVFALLFIYTCWEHCLTLGWLEWLYASIAIWCFDRVVRIVRLLIFGFPKATVSMVSEDTMKIVVPKDKSIIKFHSKPGQYVFIYFMRPTMFWQSHPFTVMDSIHNDNECVLFIKAKQGLTGRLAKYLTKLPNQSATIRVSFEGPYGESSPAGKYDKALLMAGGNGIPGPLDHALKLSRKGKESKLVWVTQTFDSMAWLSEELQMLENSKAEVHIYLTREQNPNQCVEEEKTALVLDLHSDSSDMKNEEINGTSRTTLTASGDSEEVEEVLKVRGYAEHLSKFIHFHYGRPDLLQVISSTLEENGSCSTAIVTCGPDSFCGGIRGITANLLIGSKGRIDLFEELQVW